MTAPLTEAFADSFQSAPLTEARGDLGHFQEPSRGAGFNPLPSPKQGETDRPRATSPRRRLPSPKQGETPGWRVLRRLVSKFQSAPLTEARGDAAWANAFQSGCGGLDQLGFNPLPSPKQGETINPLPSPKQGETLAFFSARGDPSLACFNPLPSPKQGETQSAPLTEARGDAAD